MSEKANFEANYVVDRELLSIAARDKNLSDSSFRILATAKNGEITPEIQEWADNALFNWLTEKKD